MLKRFAAIGLSAVLFAGTVTGCAYSDTAARVNGQETENNTEPTAYVETLEAKYNPRAESLEIPHYGSDDERGEASSTKEIVPVVHEVLQIDDSMSDLLGTTALAYVNNYVNVRSGPTTEDEVVGKIYNFCAATILDVVDGEDGKWFLITSGNVVGYIKSEFFLVGEEANAMLPEVGVLMGTVTEDYLRVRSAPDLSDPTNVFTFYELGTEVFIDELTDDGWAKITSDDASTGYVYAECLDIERVFKSAITLEEEAEEIARREAQEEAARKAQEEYEEALRLQEEAEQKAKEAQEAWEQQQREAQAAWEQQQAAWAQQQEAAQQEELQRQQQEAQAAWEQQQREAQEAWERQQAEAQQNTENASNDALAAQRNAVVQYALQFVGNPYVHGGRSLVTGTDCSGFTSLVYQNFGYYLSYTPEGQSGQGVRVDINDLRPGDLLFYSNSIKYLGHVGMYIGNGQIVHAGTEATGIEVRSAFYRQPLFANRIIN